MYSHSISGSSRRLVLAILLGIAFNFLSEHDRTGPSIAVAARVFLRAGVALLGLRVSLDMIRDMPELNTVLRQFQVRENHYEQIDFNIVEEERPPMIEVPAYREKRGIVD